jgi:hypothetical protein
MIMKHSYVNFKVTILHFCHTNVKYGIWKFIRSNFWTLL